MQEDEHRVSSTTGRGGGYEVEQRITVASPPSIILEGIARYFNARGKVLHLIVPLKDVGEPGALALERKVAVEFDAHPNRPVKEGDEGRIDFRWLPQGAIVPSFIGSLSARARGIETELVLAGHYQPPFEPLDAAIGAAFDDHAAQATGRVLLEELKAVLETEFETLKEFSHNREEETERADRVPHLGWKTRREGF